MPGSQELAQRFAVAAEMVGSGKIPNLSQDEQLRFYGLYAVVNKGEAPREAPSAYLDPRGFAKWTAWAAESAMSREEAMEEYVSLTTELAARPLNGDERKGQESASGGGFGNKGSGGFDEVDESRPAGWGNAQFDICHWASVGDVKSVRFFLTKKGVSANYRDEDQLTPLMRAADRNETQVADVLAAAGADMNATDEEGQTALHYAAYCDHAEMAGLLVTYGAATDLKAADGLTPIEAASADTAAVITLAKEGKWKRTSAPAADCGSRAILKRRPPAQTLAIVALAVAISAALYMRRYQSKVA